MSDRIPVLLVDDDPDLREVTASFLEREVDRIAVETAPDADGALDVLADREIECIVSDYEMPGRDGLALLEAVRERDPELPFILFTGRGSEAVASEAISAGVTDYLRKRGGTERYERLANRIVEAVEKRRAERDAERERHRAFIEHASDVVAVLSRDWEFRYLSPSCERVTGHVPSDLLGERSLDYVHPADREAVEEAFGEPGDGEAAPTAEYRFETADGEYRWLESVGSGRTETGGDEGYVVTTRDVSARKERERTLARLRERTRELNYARTAEEAAELAVDAVDDLIDAGLSGIHLRTDDGERLEPVALGDSVPTLFETQPSYDRGEPPGTRAALAWEAFEGDESVVVDKLSSYGPLDEPSPAESLVLRPIGDHGLFVVSSPEPHAFTDTDVLVAEILSQHLEAALDRVDRESRVERLHGATRTFVRAESREEIAERAVEAATDVLGFSIVTVRVHDEAAGGLVPMAVSPEAAELLPDRETFTPDGGSLNWGAFEAGEIRMYDDIRTTDALDADTALRSLLVVPIGEYGTIAIGETEPGVFGGVDEYLAGILATAAETAFQAEARTRRLAERTAELERQNDRLEEFAGVVSHDLRNPLEVARGRTELAREERDSEHLAAVERAHDRMTALIDDLLALAREGAPVTDPDGVDLGRVVDACWRTVDTRDATLRAEADGTVSADEGRLKQLLENLMRNAIEHGGDDVTVTVGPLPDGFYVADDGPGIEPDRRAEVFDVGCSTSRSGTGFGLRIVQQAADAHGWSVRAVESDEGGARFEITGVESAD